MSQLKSQTIKDVSSRSGTTLKLHPNKSGRTPLMNFGQKAIAAYWESRTIRGQRWEAENPTAAKRLAIAMSISTMPTTGFTTTWTKSNLKSTKVDESIYPKRMIDGHSIRPDGNPSVLFYESFCWEGVWLSIIQYGSITYKPWAETRRFT